MNQKPSSFRNPFLFVVGCPRSGTTLLQRMLNAHPQLAVANDTHFIPRAIQAVIPGGTTDLTGVMDPQKLPGLVCWIRQYHRFPRLGISDATFERASLRARTYQEFVSLLYTEFSRMYGKSLGGEKTPDYVRHLPFLYELFPWAKFVHIIRDGRDVALSTLQWARSDKGPGKYALWREDPVAVCALWWRWQVQSGRAARRILPPDRCLEVKYEEFVRDSEGVLRSVTDFLRISFAEEMLRFNEGRIREKEGLSAKKAWMAPTPGLRDWRTQLDDRSIELFEALSGDLLKELGYPLKFKTHSPEILERACACSRWWKNSRARSTRPKLSRTVACSPEK